MRDRLTNAIERARSVLGKLYESSTPSDEVERFYRFAYLVRFSFNKLRRGTMPDKNVGVKARFVDKLERLAPHLQNVRVRNGDYEKVIEVYDGPDTFFFLDPPYAGYDADCRVGAGHKDWDEERFAKVLRKIRGRFLCTYGLRGDAELFKDFGTESCGVQMACITVARKSAISGWELTSKNKPLARPMVSEMACQ